MNQFLNQHGFTHTGTTEETNFTTLPVGSEQVNHLNSGHENGVAGVLILKSGCSAVNRGNAGCLYLALVINGLTEKVHHTTKRAFPYRHGNGSPGVADLNTTDQTVCGVHGNGAEYIAAKVLSHFKGQVVFLVADGGIGAFQRVQNRGQLALRELDVTHSTQHLGDFSNGS